MSHLSTTASAASRHAERAQLDRLCTSIRGKLQFMDYLVRAAAADIERFDGEHDAGTRIFLRQLIEMHTANLSVECENMGLLSELCEALESAVAPETIPAGFRNGDAA